MKEELIPPSEQKMILLENLNLAENKSLYWRSLRQRRMLQSC